MEIHKENITSVTWNYLPSEPMGSNITKCSLTVVHNGITTVIPNSSSNKDYLIVQQWIADGGTVIDNPPE